MADEMTNQSTETTETESGFEDLFADEAPETEPTQAEETPETAPKEEAPFMTVKYNGAEQNLSKEDAITFAQKGMNYDKIHNQLEQLRNDPTMKVFAEQAQRAGLSLPEYAQRLQQFQAESEMTRIANEFKRENPDVTDEVARKYAEAQYQNAAMQKQQQQAQQLAQIEADKQKMAYSQLEAFLNVYPNVDIEHLPVEVIDEINAGEPLLSAYRAYENKQMKDTIKALRQNKDNEAVATGNLSENKGSMEGGDPFLAGLLG
jgi:hypothetical protein